MTAHFSREKELMNCLSQVLSTFVSSNDYLSPSIVYQSISGTGKAPKGGFGLSPSLANLLFQYCRLHKGLHFEEIQILLTQLVP